ncbi:MAG: histidine--tRNA ligase [Alphaproteobacteria bacterium]|nr:histidine--tRNA ligase [Alphaproteobacteria bacterium]
MSEKKKIFKPLPISGFPEWLPEVRAVELQWFDHIRRVFESYGFCNIETPSVELLDALKAKGGDGEADVDKEIYVLERYHKEESDKEARLALHFDQTVPLARYTAQHFNELTFPFKRYQMQRVWRGERPQAGRFREFYQCDIDVINVDNLPLHFDAEMPAIIWEVFSQLPCYDPLKNVSAPVPLTEVRKIQVRISNRKILIGYLDGVGINNKKIQSILIRAIDKLNKEPFPVLTGKLADEILSAGIAPNEKDEIIEYFFEFTKVCQKPFSDGEELQDNLRSSRYFNTSNAMLKEGVEDLSFVLNQLSHLPSSAVVADLSIVRGLDYYTGTVYETVFLDDPGYGSICSGGRYDDLAGNYINKHLPGVGISIGFSRLFDRLRQENKLPVSRVSPADIMVVMPSEERRSLTMQTAQKLRAQGYKVETFHNPTKLARQLAYAEKKGIPYVWFPPFEDGKDHEIKNMQTGTQSKADPDKWQKDD